MLLLVLFAVLIILYYRIDGQFDSVNCIVAGIWFFVSLLAYINPLNLYPLSTYCQIIISLHFLAYFVGYALLVYYSKASGISCERNEPLRYVYGYLANSVVIFIVLLLSIRFWSVFIDFMSLYGFAGIFSAGSQVYNSRGTEISLGIGVVLPIGYLSIFVGSVWYRSSRYKNLLKKLMYVYMMITPFLIAFFLQQRLNILILFVLYLHLNYLYGVRVMNIRMLLYLVIGIFSVSISRGIEMNSYLLGDSFLANISAGIAYYASIGVFAFDQFLSANGSLNNSDNYSLNGALRLIEFIFVTDLGSIIETREFFTPLRTITATSLMMLWSDYNFMSIAFMPFIGAVTCITSRSNTSNVFLFLIASSLVIIMGVSFFALMTFNGSFWMFMLSGFFFSVILHYDRKRFGPCMDQHMNMNRGW